MVEFLKLDHLDEISSLNSTTDAINLDKNTELVFTDEIITPGSNSQAHIESTIQTLSDDEIQSAENSTMPETPPTEMENLNYTSGINITQKIANGHEEDSSLRIDSLEINTFEIETGK